MGSVGFPSLNSDCLNMIFPLVVGNSIPLTATLSTICRTWHSHLQNDSVWKSIFDFHITNNSEIPSALTCREKVKTFFTDNGKELQEMLDRFNCGVNAKRILDKNIDNTQLFITMLEQLQMEAMAFCLLYKPFIDANKIAHLLFDATRTQGLLTSGSPEIAFCFQMLIKKHYDLKTFFKDRLEIDQRQSTSEFYAFYEICSRILYRNVKGFGLKDYLCSGLDLRPYNEKSSILVRVLHEARTYYRGGFYSTYSAQSYLAARFDNKKLIDLRADDEFSEEEMRQLIHDVIFESGIDHEQQRQYSPNIGNAMAVKPIEMLESCAEEESMPKKNIFKDVLNEYREAKAKKSMKMGET
jgi:hypothetical protein